MESPHREDVTRLTLLKEVQQDNLSPKAALAGRTPHMRVSVLVGRGSVLAAEFRSGGVSRRFPLIEEYT